MCRISRVALAAALLAGVVTPALSADLIIDPGVEAAPRPIYGGWYLRGYLGMTNQRVDELDTDLYDDPTIISHGWHDSGGFDSSPLFGGGVGYEFNDWLRGDVTVEYRGGADLHALDWVESSINGLYTNDYRGEKSEWLTLANAYVDLGTFSGITPYVGAGIGASYNKISGFRDLNVLTGGGAWAPDDAEWNLAWALHAGLGIQATDRMVIDLGYSFVSLGDARTGPLQNDDPAMTLPNDGFRFNDLTSHDLKLGVRYLFN
jgi:opacity protein-like surface antigen